MISKNQLILIRETKEIKNTMYFETSKKISSIYNLKENDLTLEINITTISIERTKNEIKIIYLVDDSKNKYEYYLTWDN